MISQQWADECIEFYGRILNGKKAHWCNDFDGLPIDETCYEMNHCLCEIIDEEE